ncbi:hypothetical protein V2G26_016454 [Clonostachys chloroleuca]
MRYGPDSTKSPALTAMVHWLSPEPPHHVGLKPNFFAQMLRWIKHPDTTRPNFLHKNPRNREALRKSIQRRENQGSRVQLWFSQPSNNGVGEKIAMILLQPIAGIYHLQNTFTNILELS